jgi:hypothetical protein
MTNGFEYESPWRRITINPEDTIALFAGLIALLFGVSMIAGWIPINGWTVGVITLSGVTPGLAKIVSARSGSKNTDQEDSKK